MRRIGRTGITTGLAKGILLIGVLGTAPLVEQRLGNERLGVWLTLVTFTSLLGFADLGLGNGIMTRVAESSGANDLTPARIAVANGLAVLGTVAVVIAAAAILGRTLLNLPSLFGVTDPGVYEDVSQAVLAFVVLFAVGLPLATVEKAQWGLGRGYIASTWLFGSAVTTILSVLIILRNGGQLFHLAVAFAGVPVLFAAGNALWSFRGPLKHLWPRSKDISFKESGQLLRIGSMYLVLQLAAALAFSTDNLIVANYLGAGVVPSLAIPARLFGLVSFGLGLFVMPMWPEYASAVGAKSGTWARQAVRKVIWLAGGLSIALAIVVAASTSLTLPLLGLPRGATTSLLIGLALSTVALVLGSTLSVFFNALGEMRFQVKASIAMVVAVVGLKVLLVTRAGIEGVVWGGVIGYLAVMGPTYLWHTPRVMKRIGDPT